MTVFTDLLGPVVADRPDAIAVTDDGGRRLTYGELWRAAVALARRIAERPKVDHVLLAMRNDVDLVVAMAAALLAGVPFVPLELRHPRGYLSSLTERFPSGLVLCGPATESAAAGIAAQDRLLVPHAPAASPLPPPAGGQGAAYVLFTSGSTGRPKGVRVSQHVLFAYLEWIGQLVPAMRVGAVAHSSTAFDFSLPALLGPLCYGGRVDLVSSEQALIDRLRRPDPCGLLRLTPSHITAFHEFFPADRPMTAPGGVLVGGEVLTWQHIQALRSALPPDTPIWNQWGPTETVIGCVTQRVDDLDESGPVPLGRVRPHTTVTVVDDQLAPVPAGVTGELVVSGLLSDGYLDPAADRDAFVEHPEWGRTYRTGDLGYLGEDGLLYFAGRRDHQVKIRGHRIELAATESVLARAPRVRDVAVYVEPDPVRGDRLAACLVLSAGTDHQLAAAEIDAWLADRLPYYARPTVLRYARSLPVTVNGKRDVPAMRSLPMLRASGGGPDRPAGDGVERLAALVEELLGVAAGPDDNFFALGGDSIVLLKLIARARVAGVELAIADVFATPTLRELAAAAEPARPAATPGAPAADGAGAPVTPAQLGMLVYGTEDDGAAVYGVANVFVVEEPLEAAALAAAWRTVLHEFAALRSTFSYGADERWRLVTSATPSADQVTIRSGVPDTDVALLELTRERAAQASAPDRPLTVEVLTGARTHVVLAHHHGILDGWSKAMLLDRVLHHARWATGRADEPPPPVRDRMPELQRQLVTAAADPELRTFWSDRLSAAPASLFGEDSAREPDFREFDVVLSDELWCSVADRAHAAGVTVPTVFTAAFAATLVACLRTSEVTFGVTTSLRGVVPAAGEDTVGLCLNSVPCRVELDPARPWSECLPGLHHELGALWQHGAVDLMDLAGTAGRPLSQLMDTLLVFQNYPGAVARFTGQDQDGRQGLRTVHFQDHTNFALTVSVYPAAPGRWAMRVTYDAARVRPAAADGFAAGLSAVLTGLCGDPTAPIADTPLTRHGASPVVEYSVDRRPVPDVLEQFDRTRAGRPDDTAIVLSTGARLSYRDTHERSTRLAAALARAGVGAGSALGLLVDHHGEALVAAVAALRLGAHYVPLETQWSVPHLRHVCRRLSIGVVATVADTQDLAGATGVATVRADGNHPDAAEVHAAGMPADLPAVALFTSGTTGEPKAALLSRGGVSAMVHAARGLLPAGPVSTIRFSRLAFDMSTLDMWLALATGGTCAFPATRTPEPAEFAEALRAHRPDLVVLPPGYFNLCVDELPEMFAGARTVIIGGEVPSPTHVAAAESRHPHLRVRNIYGPTETTTFVTCGPVEERAALDAPPLGAALPSTRIVVVDHLLRPVPAGIPGELCVAGPQVGLGYAGAPAQTAEAFVPTPGGARMYRTGDLGYLGGDGHYYYLGRLDRQVKIRGHRVEPAGVEALLRRHEQVLDAAVIARGGTDSRMVAFVVPAPGAPEQSALAAELSHALSATVPAYLQPDAIFSRPALPYTANGKVDDDLLWTESQRMPAPADPSWRGDDACTSAVAQAWTDVLDRPFHHDADFLAVGGNSLLAMRLAMRLEKAIGIRLSMRAIFEARTGRELVERAARLLENVREAHA